MKTIRPEPACRRAALLPMAALTGTYLSGCAIEPLTAAPAPAAPTVASVVQVYVYPSKAQSSAQLDRDRYECHQWSAQQTHFDPSAGTNGRQPVVIESRTSSVNTTAGAIA